MRTSGLADSSRESLVGNLQTSLENLIAGVRENSTIMLPKALAEPLEVALEAEIKRWEQRSQTDPDARPVLRAFLGLRELLWELGLGREAPPTKDRSRPNEDTGGSTRSHRDRVQRFDVEN